MDRDQILITLRERILAFATSRLSRDQAEDLTQDVLAVLHAKYPQVTELVELVPLAFQVLRFKMLDAHRKALRRGEYNQESVEEMPLTDTGDDPMVQLDQKQRVDRLLTAITQLGERCRELFTWKLEGKSFPEIQQLMGQPSINRFIPGTYAAENSCWPSWEAHGNDWLFSFYVLLFTFHTT